MELNRRTFLKGCTAAGVAALGGAALSGCSPKTSSSESESSSTGYSFETPPEKVSESEIVNTVTDDVIVIGSGVSGLMTAASVLREGGNVTLFSAGTKPVARGGSHCAVNTKCQAEHGYNITPDNIAPTINNEISRQNYLVDSKKWWTWVNNSGEAIDWLSDLMAENGYGTTLELPYTDPNGTFDILPVAHNFYGPDTTNPGGEGVMLVIDVLEQYILDNGGTIMYSHKAEYLEQDSSGRVTGVIASNDDGYVRFNANKAVVMATGDFSTNHEMMEKYCPAWADFVASTTNYDATFQFGGLMPGDGQKMGLWAGAAWQRSNPNAPMIGWSVFPSPYASINHPGIMLNINGERFINEDTTAILAGYSVAEQPERSVFAVWDSDLAYRFSSWAANGGNVDNVGVHPSTSEEKAAEFEAGVEDGTYVKGDTIEEVLQQLNEQGGINVEAAAAQIAQYNEYAANGVDEQFHKSTNYLFPIEKGPFYGEYSQVGSKQFLTVLGGLRTSDRCEVCDENDQPIEGLYNVGTMMGDTFSGVYNFCLSGHNLGMTCVTYPYLLGKWLCE
jgi:succinate dehydrogenase/fumarate reductase flavoprotein subunit